MHLLPGIADRWIWQADLHLPDPAGHALWGNAFGPQCTLAVRSFAAHRHPTARAVVTPTLPGSRRPAAPVLRLLAFLLLPLLKQKDGPGCS